MANEEQLALLKAGVEGWNKWRIANNWQRPIDLINTDLSGVNLIGADLRRAKLIDANLHRAKLVGADLSEANLNEADLSNTNLSRCSLVEANIGNAKISNSRVYGVNVWDLKGEFKEQKDLIITPPGQLSITVNDLLLGKETYIFHAV